jgi:hypothetical protein
MLHADAPVKVAGARRSRSESIAASRSPIWLCRSMSRLRRVEVAGEEPAVDELGLQLRWRDFRRPRCGDAGAVTERGQ